MIRVSKNPELPIERSVSSRTHATKSPSKDTAGSESANRPLASEILRMRPVAANEEDPVAGAGVGEAVATGGHRRLPLAAAGVGELNRASAATPSATAGTFAQKRS